MSRPHTRVLLPLLACIISTTIVACEDDTSSEKTCNAQNCAAPNICIDNNCVPPQSECSIKEECPADHDCIDAKCTPQNNTCTQNDECSPLICYNQQCTAPIAPGQACTKGEIPCVDNYPCSDGFCAQYVTEGGACNDADQLCDPKSHVCIEGKCTPIIPNGEFCMGIYPGECGNNAMCVNNMCTTYSKEGEQCNKPGYVCSNAVKQLKCRDHVCILHADKNEACHVETKPCFDENFVCLGNKCVEKRGECTSDEKCASDSYCCTEAACDVKNVCIPYGEGPRGNTNEACSYKTVVGLFEADVQCAWNGPPQNDPFPAHSNVYMTPMVMNLPHDSGSAQEIAFIAYNCSDGSSPILSGTSKDCFGVIRIINGETCQQLETIYDPEFHFIGASSVGLIDLDNDSNIEIVAYIAAVNAQGTRTDHMNGYVAYRWDKDEKKYVRYWNTTQSSSNPKVNYTHMDGPSFVDVDDDGLPEVIGATGDLYNGRTGQRINSDSVALTLGSVSGTIGYTAVGLLTQKTDVEIIARNAIYAWNRQEKKWNQRTPYTSGAMAAGSYAYADFGTWDESTQSFDFEKLDGVAEIIVSYNGVYVMTHHGHIVFKIEGYSGSGPVGIADFDGDSLPEITAAFGNVYIACDPRCKAAQPNCSATQDGIMWTYPIHDLSSRNTTSSVFDFDADGRAEITLADECYVRVFDGKSGEVLFSKFRNSCGQSDNPVIVDTDNDASAEMVILQDFGCGGSIACAPIDPIHNGIRCTQNNHCKSQICTNGFCACSEDAQCNSQETLSQNLPLEYRCVDAIDPKDGKRCRAAHPPESKSTGIRILRDRLDRWASSRNIWNQFSYNITNINDDGTIPKTSLWLQNFLQPGLNNFRANAQGSLGANKAPDITGILNKDNLCVKNDAKVTLSGVICNRGTKMVSAKMPATFYSILQDLVPQKLCTAYTSENVPVGSCLPVSCELTQVTNGPIRMVVNDDGNGGRTTVECNDQNNTDEVVLESCRVN